MNFFMKLRFVKQNYQKALILLRAKLNISQHELADLLNVSYPFVSRWENGHFEPTKIAKVRLEQLLKENDIKLEEVDE